MVGLEKADDAGVYKLTEKTALIQTVDFFTPMVDDPYTFGQIAAANALSDIYAMGGKPLTAMNIVGFPSKTLKISVLKQLLKGGLEKIQEAGAVLVGGHTVDDVELKYGLAVSGIVHPAKIITNANARIGDKLILTKPIGLAIISTAIKAGKASRQIINKAVKSMTFLNRKASEIMQAIGVNACTDITGFSLLGHIHEMAENSGVSTTINLSSVPYFPEAKVFAQQGFIPGATYRNKEFYLPHIKIKTLISDALLNILFDPQTSGGLLISVPSSKSQRLLKRLHAEGIKTATIIGEVIKARKGQIVIE